MGSIFKMTRRSIAASKGRFIALTMIIALSVGFFSGLKMTKGAMVKTLNTYTITQNMFDFRLISTLGFSQEDVDGFAELSGVTEAEGCISRDALVCLVGGSERVFRIANVPERINLPSLTAGRLPEKADECIVDADGYPEKELGKTITITSGNTDETLDAFSGRSFTIVGFCESPVYLGINRGVASAGNGSLTGYMYIPSENFTSNVFSEVQITLEKDANIYTDEYDDVISSHREEISSALTAAADKRYQGILMQNNLTEETASAAGISKPKTYLLTRDENAGYAGFENDTAIVSGIANVFPIFFIMVAMLVCVTTMTRMVSEERTQIGTLKATGYSAAAISAKYLLYAGIACFIGWGLGFFLGTWGIPKIFWLAYAKLYDFGSLEYKFSLPMCIGTLAVAVLGIVGSAYASARRELLGEPADLIRPAAPKAGKRILLEHIGFIWNRLRFIPKAVTRNLFHYKKRLIMMLVGISGCTALLVTGFGVRASLIHVGDIQYGELHKYDYNVALSDVGVLDDCDFVDSYLPAIEKRVELSGGGKTENVQLLCFGGGDVSEFFAIRHGGSDISLPDKGEIIVSSQAAASLGLSNGSTVTLGDGTVVSDLLTVSGVFDNYIYNYAIVSAETYEEIYGSFKASSAFLSSDDDDAVKQLLALKGVSSVTSADERRQILNDSLSCLDYIIIMVVFFAGSLAFIVIYNLTNINLAERSREIATVKVLGFNSKETKSYILRENVIMAFIAGLIGMPLGVALHRFVLHSINIDNISFPVRLGKVEMTAAFVMTVLFAVLVNIYMKRKVDKIPMAESLKTVE